MRVLFLLLMLVLLPLCGCVSGDVLSYRHALEARDSVYALTPDSALPSSALRVFEAQADAWVEYEAAKLKVSNDASE